MRKFTNSKKYAISVVGFIEDFKVKKHKVLVIHKNLIHLLKELTFSKCFLRLMSTAPGLFIPERRNIHEPLCAYLCKWYRQMTHHGRSAVQEVISIFWGFIDNIAYMLYRYGGK